MNRGRILIGTLILVVAVGLLVGACNGVSATPVPTPAPVDVGATVTAAIETAIAGIATATPIPTYTPIPASVPNSGPGNFTGSFLSDMRPVEINFLSLTQSGNEVSGYLVTVGPDGNGSTRSIPISLKGTADVDALTLSPGSAILSIFTGALITGRRTGDQITLSYPRGSGEIESMKMVPASQSEFNNLLSQWKSDLAYQLQQPLPTAYLGITGESMSLVSADYAALYNIRDQSGDAPLRGWLVETVEKGSAAERAGLLAHDVILKVDAYPLDRTYGLLNALENFSPGDTVDLTVLRTGRVVSVSATLGARK